MKLETKRILLSIGILFVIYAGIVPALPTVVWHVITFAIAGWYIGGWIFELSKKIIKDE